MLSFGQYEMKSSEPTPFRGSISMRWRSLESPQFPLHASHFAFKSVAKWRFWERLKSNGKFYDNFSSGKGCRSVGLNVYGKNKLLAMFQFSKAHNSFYYPLTAFFNLLKMIDLRQVEILVILYAINLMVRKKVKSSEASRSLPGHASIYFLSPINGI